MTGTFYTLQIHKEKDIRDKEGLKIFGVQILKFLPEGWIHFPHFTPTKPLLFQCKSLEKEGKWNEEAFRTIYLPAFLKHTSQNEYAKEEIRTIQKHLDAGEDVYYACYCRHHHLCHRSIAATIIERNGYSVIRN